MIRKSLIFGLLLQVWWTSATDCEVPVQINSGPVCGKIFTAENNIEYYSFRGIPYAKPPVGNRRFGRPEAPDAWTEPLQATVEGPACPQKDFVFGYLPIQIRGQSEDCLYANVHVPKTAELNLSITTSQSDNTGLPILVAIHGGIFTSGSGNSDTFGPEYFMEKGEVITITFNYRLNVLGFLSLNNSKVPGNDGLRDMILLLKWVQENARAFGGNPNDVTLMGVASGSSAAHSLAISKAAQGLFHRVILLSATAIPSYYSTSKAYAKSISDTFLTQVGINSTDPDEIYQQLIDMPINKIMFANSAVQYASGLIPFCPVVEDVYDNVLQVLDDEPTALIAQGRDKDYPMLISFTSNELELLKWVFIMIDFMNRVASTPQAVLSAKLLYSLSSDQITELTAKVHQHYFNGSDPTLDQVITCLSDTYIKYPTLKLVEWRAALGATTYFSQFSYTSESGFLDNALWIDHEGACHMEDQTYLFKFNSVLNNYQITAKDQQMREWMSTIVHKFISCSNPTCLTDSESPWPSVNSSQIMFNDNREPMVYNYGPLTAELQGMVEFLDTIDAESKAISDALKSGTA